MSIKDWLENEIISKFDGYKGRLFVFGTAIIFLNFLVWTQVYAAVFKARDLKINFFDVGQGDSELVILPGGVKILIDGGPPNGRLLENLAEILPPTDRYIDLVVLSHSQLDHFGGLIEIIKRYRIGAFIWNGRGGIVPAFRDLMNLVEAKGTPSVVLARNDGIHYGASDLRVLLPDDQTLRSRDLNDTALVLELVSKNSRTLFTGDIGAETEKKVILALTNGVDVLKIAHHGSRFSSSEEFLGALQPKLAMIEVGKNNYGHPTSDVLNRLKNIGASIFRTDRNGNVELAIDGRRIKVFAEK
ncbi:MAG: Metallo-beta-lactamase family protein [Candidatus Jorgensenbacteria bacterium GW2011_GWA1_48_11]|uniref:Metallo-beta-lactamase family protein n=1 Tax=Candidatus Jorgensenbacteria bacterium GW2011_GWA1_48_11 TaxID=1618660 RepID=A0A0G1U9T9_9BACT|nr:MAG: Metallo-beta-lactamase family protein [Candidatus Jorgensenbacteria bacterium GW2011_GWA1_48_11]KKW12333.1 MAG: Metallo-beta-lactamase family protein [Candidatus Jorgensenbacteria bacterium GW2011_GWB1_49_9]